MNRCCALVILPFVLLPLAGCRPGSEIVPVQGVVLLDGQPLKEASVHFVPEGEGRDATATTDDDGRFALSTVDPGDGATPGSYKIVITPREPTVEAPPAKSAEEAMEAAAAAAAAGPPPKPVGPAVPEQYTRADLTPLKQSVPVEKEIVIDLKSQ